MLSYYVPCCDVRYDFRIKTIFGSSLSSVVGERMSYLRYLCLFVHSGVQHILRCVFLRLVYPMSPVSLDCHFLIAPSVFANVYFRATVGSSQRIGTVNLPHS